MARSDYVPYLLKKEKNDYLCSMKQKILLFLVCFSLTTAMAANQRFKIAGQGKTALIVVDNKDWQSVIRAAQDLGDDVRKVSGTASEVIILEKVG